MHTQAQGEGGAGRRCQHLQLPKPKIINPLRRIHNLLLGPRPFFLSFTRPLGVRLALTLPCTRTVEKDAGRPRLVLRVFLGLPAHSLPTSLPPHHRSTISSTDTAAHRKT